MKTIAGILVVAAVMTVGFAAQSVTHAQSGRVHQVCIGEFESTCKRYPITDFYGCKDTGPNALCIRYCGKLETPQTCTVTQRPGTRAEPGNRCGYSWVDVRCL